MEVDERCLHSLGLPRIVIRPGSGSGRKFHRAHATCHLSAPIGDIFPVRSIRTICLSGRSSVARRRNGVEVKYGLKMKQSQSLVQSMPSLPHYYYVSWAARVPPNPHAISPPLIIPTYQNIHPPNSTPAASFFPDVFLICPTCVRPSSHADHCMPPRPQGDPSSICCISSYYYYKVFHM